MLAAFPCLKIINAMSAQNDHEKIIQFFISILKNEFIAK